MSPRLIRRELYHMRGVPDSPAKKWVARSKDVARVAPNKKRFAPPLVLRRVPAGRQAGSRSSETLDGEGDGVSAAEAEGSDAALEVEALRSLVTVNAAAPSLVPGALPAVTVPSFLNAGFSFARASIVVSSRGDSSYLITSGSPFFCGTSMGRICASKKQDLRARTAFWWLSTAKRSCSSRVMPYFSATSSPVMPM